MTAPRTGKSPNAAPPPNAVMAKMLAASQHVAPTEAAITGLSTLAGSHAKLTERIDKGEALLKTLKAEREQLETTLLPQALEAAHVKSFTTKDGLTIEAKEIVSGSISEPKRAGALAWLRAHGHAGLIKTSVAVAFAKGQEKIAEKAKDALKKLGVEVEVKETVHSETLKAWAREMLARGEKFPAEDFGLYVGTRATVKQSRSDR